MHITLTLTGTSPLLMHNPQMVDPEFELNRAITAITNKRKKTDDDRREIARLGISLGAGLGLTDEAGRRGVVDVNGHDVALMVPSSPTG